MSIDWITVIAQIANFLILVGLLKHFLYRPIIDGIDAREREIRERMGEASEVKKSAEETEHKYREQIRSLQQGREGMLEEARQTAQAERDALLADARKKLEQEREEREAQRKAEARGYTEELQQAGAEALLSLTRKALSDLADENLEQCIVTHAARQAEKLSAQLSEAAGDTRTTVVTTRTPLPDELRQQLTPQLSRLLPDSELVFKTDPQQSPGLSIRSGVAQLGWTVESYMDRLEELLHETTATRKRGRSDAA